MTEREFEAWIQREMPAGTVISDPLWWAPRILKAARATPALPQVPEGMAIVPVEFIHVLQDAPEINPSNYDHDQVCRLNTAVNEALAMLTVAKEKS